jgi:hypothetical protein
MEFGNVLQQLGAGQIVEGIANFALEIRSQVIGN